MPSMTKERRVHPRYEMELPVTLRSHGKLIPAACIDISLGGICVLTEYTEELEPGSVEVTIDLSPKLRDVSLPGQVLRRQKGIGQRVAIQFATPPTPSHKYLRKFLSQSAN